MAELRYLTGYPPPLIEQVAALRDQAGWATGCNNATRTARTTSSPTARCTTTPRR